MTNIRPVITTGEIYHIYNRTNGSELIFSKPRHIKRFIDTINFYQAERRIRFSQIKRHPMALLSSSLNRYVEIFAFACMPDHYHLQLRQLREKGISLFISNIQNSFAKSYNLINKRIGSLFQSNFKAKLIVSEEDFIVVNRYIHLNPVSSKLIEMEDLQYSQATSYSWYLRPENNKFIQTDVMMAHFQNLSRLIRFHEDRADYQRKLKAIRKLMVDR